MILRLWARTKHVDRRSERIREVRDCARADGGEPGRCVGAEPVANSMLGTRSERDDTSVASSSSPFVVVFEGLEERIVGFEAGGFGMSDARRISARTPHTTAVSPSRTTALPEQWVRLLVFIVGLRNSAAVRPFGRIGGVSCVCGERWASRKGEGDNAAKMSRGNNKEGATVGLVAIGTDDRILNRKTACFGDTACC